MHAYPALRLAAWIYAGYLISWALPPLRVLPWLTLGAGALLLIAETRARAPRCGAPRLAPLLAALAIGLFCSPAPSAAPTPAEAPSSCELCVWITGGRQGVGAHEGAKLRLTPGRGVELPAVGECVRLAGELRPAGRIRNFRPGLAQVGAAGRVAARHRGALLIVETISPPCESEHPMPWGLGVRRRLTQAVAGSSDPFGLFRALLLADRSALDPIFYDTMRRAGLAHVLALSGLHIGFVAAVVVTLLSRLSRRSASLALALCLGALPLVVGGAPSIVRSCSAAGAWALACALGRRAAALNVLAIAALIILFSDSTAPCQAGFQLSFAATAAILLCGARPRRGIAAALRGALRIGLAAQLGTWPLVAHHFGAIALWSPLSGLAGIPLTAGLLVVLLCGLPGALWEGRIGTEVEVLGGWCATGLWWLSRWIADWPAALVDAPALSLPAALALAGAACALIHAAACGRRRTVALAAALALLGIGPELARVRRAPRFRVLVGDVGQGLAVWIGFPDGRSLLYDAGPPGYRGEPPVSYAIDRCVGRAANEILVVSHAHADHDGGVGWTAAARAPRALIYPAGRDRSERAIAAARALDLPSIPLDPGDEAEMSDWHLRRPPATPRRSVNDGSIALWAEGGGLSVFVPGDLELAGERALARAAPLPRCDLLVLGHHGSRGSSGAALLDAVAPKLAIASAGLNNSFGHPHQETLAELRRRGIALLRTDLQGALLIESDGRRWWCRSASGRSWSGRIDELGQRAITGAANRNGAGSLHADPAPVSPASLSFWGQQRAASARTRVYHPVGVPPPRRSRRGAAAFIGRRPPRAPSAAPWQAPPGRPRSAPRRPGAVPAAARAPPRAPRSRAADCGSP